MPVNQIEKINRISSEEDSESSKLLRRNEQERAISPNPYYEDSTSSHSSDTDNKLIAFAVTGKNKSASEQTGWKQVDTIAPASPSDGIQTIAKSPHSENTTFPSIEGSFTLTTEKASNEEIAALLEKANSQVPPAIQAEVDDMLGDADKQVPAVGSKILDRHMETLSMQINEALKAETPNFERIHAMVLRYCMIHMRTLTKEDQQYIAKIGEQIKIQAGKIHNTYNTWPVVILTISGGLVSAVGGSAGIVSFLVSTNKESLLTVLAANAQNISTFSTGLSSVTSLLNSKSEGERQMLGQTKKSAEDKEEEKKGAKHGNKETQKTMRAAHEEVERTRKDTVSGILRG